MRDALEKAHGAAAAALVEVAMLFRLPGELRLVLRPWHDAQVRFASGVIGEILAS